MALGTTRLTVNGDVELEAEVGDVQVTVITLVGLLIALGAGWLYTARRWPRPFPSWLGWTLANRFTLFFASRSSLLDRLELSEGLRVLDVGSGPGRLTLPIAERIGRHGQVVAMDIQADMLRQLERHAARSGLTNIRTVLGGAGQGLLDFDAFDRALMVTVLGEIVDREAAMREVYAALKPGGFLVVTEMMVDPDYQGRHTVVRLAEAAGFVVGRLFANYFTFTLQLIKPCV